MAILSMGFVERWEVVGDVVGSAGKKFAKFGEARVGICAGRNTLGLVGTSGFGARKLGFAGSARQVNIEMLSERCKEIACQM